MGASGNGVQLIVAEDDEDQYILIKSALENAGLRDELVWVKDGKELLDFLQRRGAHSDVPENARRRVVILDLNMPRMDGREALEFIKADPGLRGIPIIVMTTSNIQEDVALSYEHGASSFIRKPVAFEEFVKVAGLFKRYWLDLVELPVAGGVPWIKE